MRAHTRAVAMLLAVLCVASGAIGHILADPHIRALGQLHEAETILTRGLFASGSSWTDAIRLANAAVQADPSPADVCAQLDYLTRQAGGVHSSFKPAPRSGCRLQHGPALPTDTRPSVQVTGGIGVLTLPTFNAPGTPAADRYAACGQNAIRAAAGSARRGWIIDLRANPGGDLYPMLAALSPLLPEGELLQFIDRFGAAQPVTLRADGLYNGAARQMRLPAGVAGSVRAPAIVVEQGPRTGSAAEAVLVALRGLGPRVRTIGAPSAGLTTGNTTFDLSDGAHIVLSTGRMASPSGKIYQGRIQPQVATDPNDADPLAFAEQALDHIHRQTASGRALLRTTTGSHT